MADLGLHSGAAVTLDYDAIDAIADHAVVQLLQRPGLGPHQLLGLSSTSYVPSRLSAASERDPATDPSLPNADAEVARLSAKGFAE
jgi:hypothetical protein